MPATKVSRRSHAKSRNGCRVCKRRKIKCDEQRPSCQNCLKHGAECIFPPCDVKGQTPFAFIQPADLSPMGGSRIDFELLHHFSVSTCFTLSPDPAVRSFWQVDAPQLAFANDLVFHALLALSARHLAECKAGQRDYYLYFADRHETTAAKLALPFVSHLAAEDAMPVYVYSILMLMSSLARPKTPGNLFLVTETGIPDWLLLLRHARRTLQALPEGTLPATFSGIYYPKVQMDTSWEIKFPEPNEALRNLDASLMARDGQDDNTLVTWSQALVELRRSLGFMLKPDALCPDTLQAILVWLSYVSHEYFEQLRMRQKDALCIFAFFCVLLQRLEWNWWADKWAVFLLSQVHSHLDDRRILLIRWPMAEIGWVS